MKGDTKMDIKENIEYWDKIDDSVLETVRGIAKLSVVPIDKNALDQHEQGIAAEAREVIIAYLEQIGGDFPVSDGEY